MIAAIPFITVIVPAFNAAEYLEGCLESILNQYFGDIEIIVVADKKSNDRTLSIADAFALRDKRISVVKISNGGITKARKVGVEHARGQYVSFVDPEDRLKGSFLSDLIDGIKTGCQIACANHADNVIECDEYVRGVLEGTRNRSLLYMLVDRALLTPDVFSTRKELNYFSDFITQLILAKKTEYIAIVNSETYEYNPASNSPSRPITYSIDYYERFMAEVEYVLGDDVDKFQKELWRLKMDTWKNLVRKGIHVPQDHKWICWLRTNGPAADDISWSDRVMLRIRSHRLQRLLLTAIAKLSRH